MENMLIVLEVLVLTTDVVEYGSEIDLGAI